MSISCQLAVKESQIVYGWWALSLFCFNIKDTICFITCAINGNLKNCELDKEKEKKKEREMKISQVHCH